MDYNCMTVVIGKKASSTGFVMVGHNEDDGGRTTVRHGWIPAAEHAQGTLLPAEEGRAPIPQAAKTHGYAWSEVRCDERGASTADLFFNDSGVSVVSDSSCGSMEDGADADILTEGGVSFNLRRMAAERAGTAREALRIVIDAVEKYGYASTGRLYIVSDKDEAFVIQVARGKHYVAGRVPDDAVVSLPNHFTFHSLRDWDEMLWSKDIISYAREKGWYTGSDEAFDFADVYQARDTLYRDFNTLRQKYTLSILQNDKRERDVRTYFEKADHRITPTELLGALTNHYEGTEDCPSNGVRKSPHHGNITVCRGSTVESVAVQFAERAEDTIQWTAYATPCLVPFLPVYPLRGPVKAIDAMDDPVRAMREHLLRIPASCAHREDGWQYVSDFRNLAEHHYKDVAEDIRAMNARFVQKCMENPHRDTEKMASEMLDMVRAFARERFTAKAELVCRAQDSFTVRVTTEAPIDPETVLFAFGGQNIEKESVKGTVCGSEITFPMPCLSITGATEGFVGGLLENGKCFGAMVIINL